MITTTPFEHALVNARIALADGRELLVEARSTCAAIDTENHWMSPAGRRFATEMEELDGAVVHALAMIDLWDSELASAGWQAGACG